MVNKKIRLMVIGMSVLFGTMLFGCGAKEKTMEEKLYVEKIAGFSSGVQNEDGGTTEIVNCQLA